MIIIMEFQRARTKTQIENRQSEILTSCASLYQEMDYEDITLKMIAERTSLSRTTIYSYYKTKEEIFLDLMKQQYIELNLELSKYVTDSETLSREQFCQYITQTILNRPLLLKLFSMQLTCIEKNCSIEQLVQFKKETAGIFDTLHLGIQKAFPAAKPEHYELFQRQLFIYVLGLYPYTHPLEKQIEAMQAANYSLPNTSEYELFYRGIYHLTEELC